MERLARSDVQRILEFTGKLYAIQNHEGLINTIVLGLQALIRGDVHSYTETNHRENSAILIDAPGGPVLTPAEQESYAEFSLQHPTIAYMRETGKMEARTISDFLSSPAWGRTDLYNHVYRPHQMRYNLGAGLTLSKSKDLLMAFGINRGTKDFSNRERMILELVRPHLLQAYWNARVVTEMEKKMAMMTATVDQLGQAVVGVDDRGRIIWATDLANRLLQKVEKRKGRKALHLPLEIQNWIQASLQQLSNMNGIPIPISHLEFERESVSIRVRFVKETDKMLLFLEERPYVVPLERLRQLGLSRRETEVLGWIAEGKSNPEIADILGIKIGTVKTHLERIYDKLGVDHRHAAMSLALELLGHNHKD